MSKNIRRTGLAAVLGLALAGSFAANGFAAAKCGDHDEIVKALASNYKESRRAMGIVSAHSVMEIFMSPEGTWTMLVTNTTGESCIAAAGEDWQEQAIKAAGFDS
jgi:hypothetical protein